MTDRELLDMAAKAAGIGLEWPQDLGGVYFLSPRKTSDWQLWNPLTYDGDALRLAVQLNLAISVESDHVFAVTRYAKEVIERGDLYVATRRAIVRAAAATAA